ncbi:glycosyltransferase family 2 protein [Longimycelium tulufanense]|nr:glycosyltransferase family 2 protein [Longimycelium tulufanense]
MSPSNSPSEQERPSSAGLPRLTVVIPVYNEESWITRSVQAVLSALTNAEWPAQVIVVDDGSTDATPQRLAELAEQHGITVVRQENQGRFRARQAGVARATGEQVLLVDSRVIVDPGALKFLRGQLTEHPERVVWGGHVNVDTDGNLYAGFWSGLVAFGWRRYFTNPRLVSFDITEFDAFPKGTGFFCAPRAMLINAGESFSSLFSDARLASDDTRMLRWIAERERIHLCPEFSATYHGRDSLSKFVRHSFFRGTTFVDSYLDSPGPVRRMLIWAIVAGLAGLGLLRRRPRTFAVLAVTTSAGLGAAVRRCGGSSGEARSVAGLFPLFAVCFGTGVLRGLGKALRKRLAR